MTRGRRPLTPDQARALEALRIASDRRRRAERTMRETTQEAKRSGCSLAYIAEAIGTSRASAARAVRRSQTQATVMEPGSQ